MDVTAGKYIEDVGATKRVARAGKHLTDESGGKK